MVATLPMIEGLTRTLNMAFGASFLGVMSYNAIVCDASQALFDRCETDLRRTDRYNSDGGKNEANCSNQTCPMWRGAAAFCWPEDAARQNRALLRSSADEVVSN